jgi:hypothetical protein
MRAIEALAVFAAFSTKTQPKIDTPMPHCYRGVMSLPRRVLLAFLCLTLSVGTPLSYASTASDAPCDAAMTGDMGNMPDCGGCGSSDKAACSAHCSAMSSAQILPSVQAARMDLAHAAPQDVLLQSFRSIAGPPGRHPPK